MIESVADLIDSLGGIVAVSNRRGVPVSTVGSWKARNSIPDEHRPDLIEMAAELGVDGVSYESLTLLHAKKVRPDPAAHPERTP